MELTAIWKIWIIGQHLYPHRKKGIYTS
uniref:Kinase D interacting substrate 220 n=1 Tax=Macaca fascicularis TaxID=9541 RepID=I7GKP2_MACFA|nr:unnamed protein product [Macaca fascicularis]